MFSCLHKAPVIRGAIFNALLPVDALSLLQGRLLSTGLVAFTAALFGRGNVGANALNRLKPNECMVALDTRKHWAP